ncbi:MAG: endonuclease III [Candidatus Aminicenantes bacterium]
MESAGKRIGAIIKILRREYPRSCTALHFKTPLQILVATILSAQSTDEKVNQITPSLFQKYQTPQDFAGADQPTLEQEVRSTGFFRNKARSIILACKKIVEDFDGKVPDSMEDLITLPGVARKTANIVLSTAFKKAEGIAVDTHVKRLASRLGLSQEKNPDKIEKDLMKIVPEEDWLDFNYMLVNHGRRICQARKPRCPWCVIRQLCPSPSDFFPELARPA